MFNKIVFRSALSSAFSCWETLLGEYEKQAQVVRLLLTRYCLQAYFFVGCKQSLFLSDSEREARESERKRDCLLACLNCLYLMYFIFIFI